MNKKTGILNLRSKKSRNWLRGLIAEPESLQTIKVLEKIYAEGGEQEFQAAIEVLKESPLFRKGLIGGNFNKKLPRILDFEKITNLKSIQIVEKFTTNKEKLSSLLGYCRKILEAIGAGQIDIAFEFSKILKENGGASSARNSGIDAACGEYIIFLDSDDYWEGNYTLQRLAEKSKDGYDFIMFGCKLLNMKNGEMRLSRNGYNIALLENSKREEALQYLLKSKDIPGAAYIFATKRKSFLK